MDRRGIQHADVRCAKVTDHEQKEHNLDGDHVLQLQPVALPEIQQIAAEHDSHCQQNMKHNLFAIRSVLYPGIVGKHAQHGQNDTEQ